MIPIELHLTRL